MVMHSQKTYNHLTLSLSQQNHSEVEDKRYNNKECEYH